ncbi:hypothetical protein HanIR_Chr01g0019871 [Helianthus annuus]|nr:hypothetical protein HanIR_Chr01g0019871 [Helianthus annuus]
MWVSVLKKRGRFRIGMGFKPAQVSAREGLRHETGFGKKWVDVGWCLKEMGQVSDRNGFRAGTSIRTRRVTARDGFWIETGSVRIEFRAETGFGTTQVLDRNGVGLGRVSGRHEFLHGTGFDAYRFDANCFDAYRFDTYLFNQYRFESNRFDLYCFDPNRFDPYRFDPYRFDANRFYKMLSKGKSLVKQMAESGCQIGPLTWDSLVKLYIEAGEIEKDDSILSRASEQNRMKPFFETYLLIMDQCKKRRHT